ncbi:Alpha/Beta hydrolase protein [Boletus edulis]|uniref:Carboxypeptidase n=1 Tax=Boletus edulis BED1 TaxID=1328754 RepID=A0AAD4BGN6_BOLED|nr:Alpha/Beta hydrolase protein [Boletus edulis]KAF8427230.1 alpha/beta-hydrolase [Boletus edulis BED1]
MVVLAKSFVALLVVTGTAGARMMRKDEVATRQAEAAKRWQCSPGPAVSSSTNVKRGGPQNITFTNPEASKFWVNGSALPFVDFDVGPSWAGLLPISNNSNETRQLFFWFFPPGPEGSLDDLIFWTNGGPGCSSLEGLLQENGPFSWSYGQAKPTVNEYSWTNLSSILWIEQPVGTGFSQGTPNIENEDQLAEQLVGFLQQFLEVFSELKGKKLWLTGESYAGTYIPYIANYIYENPTLLDLSLQGMWISDPSLSWDVVQEEIPAVDFVHKYQGLFSFNQTFLDYLDQTAAACNYTNYVSTYVTYPPNGLLPLPGNSVEFADGCDVWDDIFYAALIINPAFNIYRIWDTYPILWDVLGFPGSFPQKQSPIYFNRREVKEAIHAPLNTHWAECSNVNVFPNGDQSLPPAFTVLPNVIEKNVRTVIVHGLADFILIAEGTRIVIQNMTWNGLQGFQTPIANDSFVVDGVGAYGNMHSERGLTYYEVALSGHMVPQFAPVAAFQIMQYLMGFRDTP